MPRCCPCLRSKSISLPARTDRRHGQGRNITLGADAGEAGLVSASAVALTEGVLRTMLVSKFKLTAVILIAVGAITSGAGLYAYQGVPSGARPGSVGSGLGPGISPATPQATGDNSTHTAKLLDAYAAEVERLVRRARQEQAAGEWDGAARDLRKSVEVAENWRELLFKREKSTPRPSLPEAAVTEGLNPLAPLPLLPAGAGTQGSDPLAPIPLPAGAAAEGLAPLAPIPLPPTPVKERVDPPIGTSPPRSAECRLADLESKVNRILQALEKDGHDHAERPKPATSNPNAKRTD